MCENEFCNDIHGRFPLSLFQYFLARPFLLDPFFIHESFLGFKYRTSKRTTMIVHCKNNCFVLTTSWVIPVSSETCRVKRIKFSEGVIEGL